MYVYDFFIYTAHSKAKDNKAKALHAKATEFGLKAKALTSLVKTILYHFATHKMNLIFSAQYGAAIITFTMTSVACHVRSKIANEYLTLAIKIVTVNLKTKMA